MCQAVLPPFFVYWTYYLFHGVEFAVILSTLDLYLVSVGAKQYYLGFAISASTLTSLITAPMYGKFTDKKRSVKAVLMLNNVFEMAGSLLYFAAKNPAVIICGRLMSGIGQGSESSVLGMISRSSPNRLREFSIVFATYQLGLLLGAACNLFLGKLNFAVGPFSVDAYTAPGLFVAFIWLCHHVMVICFFRDPTPVEENEIECSERSIMEVGVEPTQWSWKVLCSGLLREEVVVCLFSTYVVIFVETGFETLFTPFTKKYFAWNGFQNSMLLSGLGLMMMLGYLVVTKLSRKVSNRFLLLVGTTAICVLHVTFLIFVIFILQKHTLSAQQSSWPASVFCLNALIFVFFVPFVFAPQITIFSEVVNKNHLGFFQGFRLAIYGIGKILGPVWVSSLLDHLPITIAVNWTLVTFSLVTILLSYKMLNTSESLEHLYSTDNQTNERTKLLSSETVL